MHRAIFTCFILIFCVGNVFCTQQQPDILLLGKDSLFLQTGWGHPSPLQTYYDQKKVKYPFEMLHTANYRGHVATWIIENNKFYLKSIQVGKKRLEPRKIIESNVESDNLNESVLANWFTGFLYVRKYDSNDGYDIKFEMYYYVKRGEVVKSAKFTDADFERIKKEYEFGKPVEEIKNANILIDYEKYIAYYFRQYDDEMITINDQKGFITRPKGKKLVLQYYNDVHLDWPFNWESKSISGIPIGTWEVVGKDVYLIDLKLHTGLGFYETEIHDIEITEIFENAESKLKAEWLNGVYLIEHRIEVEKENEFQLRNYEVESIRILEMKEGVLINQCKLKGNFKFEDIDKNTPENTKKLIKKYKELIE